MEKQKRVVKAITVIKRVHMFETYFNLRTPIRNNFNSQDLVEFHSHCPQS